MVSAFWERVVADGLQVPHDRPLVEMTADLTRMLGDSDPDVRGGVAAPTLATWIRGGVYDDLLSGLGDGMCTGLDVGLGRAGDSTVFRRSSSARVLGECIDRDAAADLLDRDTILRWGDRAVSWLVRERDLRGFVPGCGRALALAHGAAAVGALMRSPRIQQMELVVLLDALADRLLDTAGHSFADGEEDHLAAACLHGVRRDLVALEVLEPWVARITAAADPPSSAIAHNAQAFLRSLHLQLALGPQRPEVRPDLLLVLIEHLRVANATWLAGS